MQCKTGHGEIFLKGEFGSPWSESLRFKCGTPIHVWTNMLTTFFFFLHYKLQLCFVCPAHYTPFTCGKGLFKILNFEKYFEFPNFSNSTSF